MAGACDGAEALLDLLECALTQQPLRLVSDHTFVRVSL